MCARQIIFLPAAAAGAHATLLRGPSFAPRAVASTALVAVTTAVMLGIHGCLDAHGGIFLLLALFYFLSIAAPWGEADTAGGGTTGGAYGDQRLREQPYALLKMALFVGVVVLRPLGDVTSAGVGLLALCAWAPISPLAFVAQHWRSVSGAAVAGAFVYGFVHPIVGVQMMASSTMYGNVQNYGRSNHLLVPTGVLQDLLAQPDIAARAPRWLQDGFGGGLVRTTRPQHPSPMPPPPPTRRHVTPEPRHDPEDATHPLDPPPSGAHAPRSGAHSPPSCACPPRPEPSGCPPNLTLSPPAMWTIAPLPVSHRYVSRAPIPRCFVSFRWLAPT